MGTIKSTCGVCLLLLLSTANYAQIKIDSGAATDRTCLPTPLNELNPALGPTANASLELNLDQLDAADEDAFNRILWSLIKGAQPYPGTKRTSSLEIVRAY